MHGQQNVKKCMIIFYILIVTFNSVIISQQVCQ